MKIIDNRYKIEKSVENRFYNEAYIVSDIWENDKKLYMKFYNSVHQELIEYFEDNFIHLSSINHDFMLSSYKFDLVNSIDTKKTNMKLYYSVSEYIEGKKLFEITDNLSLGEKLKIILDTILVIDYLHFRGITYKLLNPSNIFVLEDNSIKIMDIVSILEEIHYGNYDDFTRYFMAPEVLINNDTDNNKKADYYSLGMLIKYLLVKDHSTDSEGNEYKNDDLFSHHQKIELNNIISELIGSYPFNDDFRLIGIIDRIVDLFNLDYTYNLIKNRDKLFFENNLIGRKKELSQVMEIDNLIYNKTNSIKGLVVEADFGIGKSRFLSEVCRRLKLKGRDVYFIEAHQSEGNDLLDMSNILKQSIKDTPADILNKYRDELSRILPELRLYFEVNESKNIDDKLERFRLYNRIANYFNELSRERIIYIVIDDLQKSNLNFLMLLDYLMNNISNNNLFFIFSFEDNLVESSSLVYQKLTEWNNKQFVTKIHLHKFDLEEIGKQVQNILGISYVPYNLSSVLFKESNGNPRHIELIIKHLYSIGEIYMNPSGVWYTKPDNYSDLYFPANINDAFEKQINIVREKYLDIFKIMSIFEDVLYKKLLIKMVDLSTAEIENQINELRTLRLVDEKLADLGHSYDIHNVELKKLIYHEMSYEEKIKLHEKAAEVIVDVYGDKLDHVLDELIYHLIKSNQYSKALEFILNKVDSLENKYSSHARLLLEKGYGLIKDTDNPNKLEILSKIVDIYSQKGESKIGNEYLDEYLILSADVGDNWHIIKGKSALLDIYYRKAEYDLAIKEIDEIEKIANINGIIEGKIIALTSRGRFGIRAGKIDDSEKWLLEAVDLSLKHNIVTYMGTIYNRLGLIKYLKGNLDEAVINYKKSIAYHQEIGDYIEATRPINNIANIYMEYYGDLDKAMENYKMGHEIASKHGIREIESVFLINLASIFSGEYNFDKALELLEEAKRGAMEIQDLNMIFFTHINTGSIYLSISEYGKACECYANAKKIFETKQIVDLEITANYHSFLGEFHELFGQWDKAIKHTSISNDLCKDYATGQYLEGQCRILRCKFFGESKFDKEKIQAVIEAYRETKLLQQRRKALLYFSGMSFLHGDRDYAISLLNEDEELIKLYNNSYLSKLRDLQLHFVDSEYNIDEILAGVQEILKDNRFYDISLILSIRIASILYSKSEYRSALKHILEALDLIYRMAIRIPDNDLQLSYIRSRKGDLIKEKISSIVEEGFNKFIDCKKLEDINDSNLYEYFDISNLIDIIGSEEFVKVAQLDYCKEALYINDVLSLVSRLKDDYKYNLDLILGFMGKETFAKKGYIFRYDEDQKKTVLLSYIGNDPYGMINNNIIKLADRSKRGFCINSNVIEIGNYTHKEFLTEDIKGIICVPIILAKNSKLNNERRKSSFDESTTLGYIYLETDRVFNRFDLERLELVRSLSNLVLINLNNYNLKIMATTDKLTGTLTRKYYEGKFEKLINAAKSSSGYFSVLMLDIDRFKIINDSYGHRKGDEILKIIGYVLNSIVRSTDVVARYGGEEFVILLKNTTEEDAYNIAEKIRKKINNLKITGIEYPITVSVGISLFPQHSQFKEELIEKADQALYFAKESGRNRVALWNAEMDNTFNRVDKLAGILTGNVDEDNRNILALMDVIQLIREKQNLKDKIFSFLARVLETIDAEHATVIYGLDKESEVYLTRARFNEDWVNTPALNKSIIQRVMQEKKGEFLIDWDNLDNIDTLSGLPNWQSIIVLPLIKNEDVKGVLYISTLLKYKEFNFNDYNLSKTMANVFASIL